MIIGNKLITRIAGSFDQAVTFNRRTIRGGDSPRKTAQNRETILGDNIAEVVEANTDGQHIVPGGILDRHRIISNGGIDITDNNILLLIDGVLQGESDRRITYSDISDGFDPLARNNFKGVSPSSRGIERLTEEQLDLQTIGRHSRRYKRGWRTWNGGTVRNGGLRHGGHIVALAVLECCGVVGC